MSDDVNNLPPSLAAKLAQDVYELVKEARPLKISIDILKQSFINNLDINDKSLLTGTSGMGFIQARTAFGIAAFGVNAYNGHAFIVLRGTDLLGDVLTDLHAGVSHSSTGWYVHDGFNQTFKSLKPDLDAFIAQMNSKNIHSVPCWPFIHAPSKQADMYDYFLPSPGVTASGEWHKMAKYTDSVMSKGWRELRSQREEVITDSKIEAWLKKETPIQFNLTNLRWLDRAIAYVATKCANALVMRLIYKMMSFIGLKPIADKAQATQEFVKGVFMQVSERVNGQVKLALNQAFYGGQGF